MNDRGLKNNVVHSVYCPSHKQVGSRTLCWCFFHRLEASRREVQVGRKELTAGGWEINKCCPVYANPIRIVKKHPPLNDFVDPR